MKQLQDARILADYISSINGFIIDRNPIITYGHMGAIITDTILQSGLNYKTVVKPRVKKILKKYPSHKTTSDFLKILTTEGSDCVLNWSHPEKINRVLKLTNFFADLKVEKEKHLKSWIVSSSNCKMLLKIKGIGPKTIDYLKKLVGISTVAVDRHIRKFVACAGIEIKGYNDIRSVVEFAADLLDIPRYSLDQAIWSHSAKN